MKWLPRPVVDTSEGQRDDGSDGDGYGNGWEELDRSSGTSEEGQSRSDGSSSAMY